MESVWPLLEDQKEGKPSAFPERSRSLVCSISSEGQRVRAVRAERCTKAFVLDVGGKEVSVACLFLLASTHPFPEESRD